MARTKNSRWWMSAVLLAAILSATALHISSSPPAESVAPATVSIKNFPGFQDPVLLESAWSLPVAKTYSQRVEFQRNASVCGPTTLSNVARSLGIHADQKTMLEGTDFKTVFGYLPKGMTLDELADLARKKLGRKVTILRDLSPAEFHEHLKSANDPARRYIVNFSREPLFATGHGHFSPLAGYLEKQDLVFILDVNEDYRPWLVKSDRLYEAMNAVDPDTHKKRGLLLIE